MSADVYEPFYGLHYLQFWLSPDLIPLCVGITIDDTRMLS